MPSAFSKSSPKSIKHPQTAISEITTGIKVSNVTAGGCYHNSQNVNVLGAPPKDENVAVAPSNLSTSVLSSSALYIA